MRQVGQKCKLSLKHLYGISREDKRTEHIPMPHDSYIKSILSFSACCESYCGLMSMVAQQMLTSQMSSLNNYG